MQDFRSGSCLVVMGLAVVGAAQEGAQAAAALQALAFGLGRARFGRAAGLLVLSAA